MFKIETPNNDTDTNYYEVPNLDGVLINKNGDLLKWNGKELIRLKTYTDKNKYVGIKLRIDKKIYFVEYIDY